MSDRFPSTFLEPIKKLLQTPRKIVVTTHHRPDGDAMGSSLALYNYLLLKGHDVQVIIPSESPDFLHWLSGNDKVLDYNLQKNEADELIKKADLIFCLDFNWLSRVEKMEDSLRKATGTKILIDHHLDPEKSFDFVFSYSDACSTCELIFEFIDKLGEKSLINKDIAECIYCGIMTDTNSFRYESMRASTHRIVAQLIEAGAVNYKIHEAVYDNVSENRLRLIGYSIKEKLIVLAEFRTAYISLSDAELNMFNFKTGDSEGIVNYALSVQGTRMAVLFVERDGMIKISFRSKGDFSVKELAAKYFDGGGHRNASGGNSTASLTDTVNKFLEILPSYKSKLTS